MTTHRALTSLMDWEGKKKKEQIFQRRKKKKKPTKNLEAIFNFLF